MASMERTSAQKKTGKTNTSTDKYVGTIRAMEGKENYYRVVGKEGSKYRIRFLDDGSSIRLLKSQVEAHPAVEGIAITVVTNETDVVPSRKRYQKGALQGVCSSEVIFYPICPNVKRCIFVEILQVSQ